MELQGGFAGVPTLALAEVREGDLIFTARPSPFQSLVELAGDPWRHVGVAKVVEGTMSCCEVAGHRFQFRPLAQIAAPPHTAVGVARFNDELAPCAASAAAWVATMVGEENLYAWDDLILTGVLLLVRRRAPAALIDQVMGLVREAERLAVESPAAGQRSFTCASFVYRAYAEAGDGCRPRVVQETVRSRPGRNRSAAAEPVSALADLLADAAQGDLGPLARALEEFTLLELSGADPAAGDLDGARIRSTATSHINADQFVATVRNLIRIFANVHTADLPTRLLVDERWVSPGDLWRLDNVALRALLPIAGSGGPA